MTKVFLSYAPADQAAARRVAEALEAIGNSVSRSADGPELLGLLQRADIVLVLWSNAAANSKWVREAALTSQYDGKLVLALIESEARPGEFPGAPAVDLTRWSGEHDVPEWRHLVDALRAAENPSATRLRRTSSISGGHNVSGKNVYVLQSTRHYMGSRMLGCGVLVGGVATLAIGIFAIHPTPERSQRGFLVAIRGTWAPEKQGCGHGTVRYDFVQDGKGASISQRGELLGRAVITQTGVVVVRRLGEKWEFERDGKFLDVTKDGVETTFVRCAL